MTRAAMSRRRPCMLDPTGRVAMVSGAARGIGRTQGTLHVGAGTFQIGRYHFVANVTMIKTDSPFGLKAN